MLTESQNPYSIVFILVFSVISVVSVYSDFSASVFYTWPTTNPFQELRNCDNSFMFTTDNSTASTQNALYVWCAKFQNNTDLQYTCRIFFTYELIT